ncbi:hypothetical protein SB717_38975, partial [Priestia sp. SIMBA_032]|uniref:hypothetical protein n=1 Tax=Priestia sp. SIMBA_032 TaxID=3085775 RepID=UPI003978C91E
VWSTSIESAVAAPNSVVKSSVNSVSRTPSRLAKQFPTRRPGTQRDRIDDITVALARPTGGSGK